MVVVGTLNTCVLAWGGPLWHHGLAERRELYRREVFDVPACWGLSMRLRHGCSTVVPMPADALLACFVMLTWVRLEARPFHIPSRIALQGWYVCQFIIRRIIRWNMANGYESSA